MDMQLLRVYLLRHGHSMYQSLKIVSGQNELGLSGLGVVQSKRVGNLLQSVKFDQVYTTQRCIESYSHIESQLKLKPRVITYTTLQREVDQGDETLKSYQEVYVLVKPKQPSSLNLEIQERVEAFLDQLIRDQIYKKSYKFFSQSDSLHLNHNFDTNNLYNPSVQQFSSYSKGSGMINILVLSHAGLIAETLKYLYQRNNSHQTNSQYPYIYARNAAIFQLDFKINNQKNWNCNVALMNSKRKINTTFDSII
ncbi:unnamed protein product (macronuclear) [Paramecium tetraurelia]|uniref:Phosphoglycerate mutase n=1 Tax=Paramecium tetraurelia TaxID=5888 RepID=A0D230_PARTE|nr:uncharacterized protein GSPATT00012603001 [Paramecium tetraurelia]CAK77097.1 unnamed protein product [Paramecium tetraurelia]|eukprot:XP_001444494.1 hypothetical protein (macronuclear) [Paramecium tetraurelia strain d4-2]